MKSLLKRPLQKKLHQAIRIAEEVRTLGERDLMLRYKHIDYHVKYLLH